MRPGTILHRMHRPVRASSRAEQRARRKDDAAVSSLLHGAMLSATCLVHAAPAAHQARRRNHCAMQAVWQQLTTAISSLTRTGGHRAVRNGVSFTFGRARSDRRM